MEEKRLSYKDEDGSTLYGYSQKNLTLVYRWLKICAFLGASFLAVVIWVLWQIKKYSIVTIYLQNCL